MAVSRYEYAMLSNAVYHDGNYIDPANEGFEKIFDKEYPQCGFEGKQRMYDDNEQLSKGIILLAG